MLPADKILQTLVQTGKAPSVQYYFFSADNIIHRSCLGLADIRSGKPAGEQTTYLAYSTTKTFTALAILQLAEKGLLDIDQPVKDHLPEFPNLGVVSARHLLAHTAGLPNPIPLSWIHLEQEHHNFRWQEFFKPVLQKHAEPKNPPNERFAYSNLGYILLGLLIEMTAQCSYDKYITEQIIAPLNLQRSDLGFEIAEPGCHSTGYHPRWNWTNPLLGLFFDKQKYMLPAEGLWKPFRPFYVNGMPYGGLVGTPRAFVRYIQELLKPDTPILSQTYRQMLFTENRTNDGKASGMSLSWYTGKLEGLNYFTHAGGGGGYYCEIRIYPEAQRGSVLFFNRTGMRDERYLDHLDTTFLAR